VNTGGHRRKAWHRPHGGAPSDVPRQVGGQLAAPAHGARRPAGRQVALKQTLFLRPLARQLARAAHGLGLFAGPAFRRLFKILPHFHFAEHAFALQFLLQGAKRLIDIIVANTDLYQWSSPSKFAVFQ